MSLGSLNLIHLNPISRVSQTLQSLLVWAFAAAALIVLGACSNSQLQYVEAKSLPAITLPPDMNARRLSEIFPIPREIPGESVTRSRVSDVSADNTFQVPFPPSLSVVSGALNKGSQISDPRFASVEKLDDRLWIVNARSPAFTWSQLLAFFRDNTTELIQLDMQAAHMITVAWESDKILVGDVSRNLSIADQISKVQYRVALAKGFQAETTEIQFSNRLIPANQPTRLDQNFTEIVRLESPLHAERLAQRIASFLNESDTASLGSSLLAASISLPERAYFSVQDNRRLLMIRASLNRVLTLLEHGLLSEGFALYDKDTSQNLFYFDWQDPHLDRSIRWYNPRTWFRKRNVYSGPNPTLIILRDAENTNKPRKFPGYFLAVSQSDDNLFSVTLTNINGSPMDEAKEAKIFEHLRDQLR